MSKRKTTKKYVFGIKLTLSLKETYSKYDIVFSNKNVTGIEEILGSLNYIDETRKVHSCLISKIDFTNGKKYSCYWCRHTATYPPLACPIKYVPNVISRTYFSEITKDRFSVKESVYSGQSIDPDIDVKLEKNDYCESDGIFCNDGSCLYAFILENKKNPLYVDSEYLFLRFMREIGATKINPAPHWRMLEEYGGTLSIEKFRENCRKIEYEPKGICRPFKSIGHAFEEKIKL